MEDFKPIMLEAVSGANEVDALGRVIPGVNAATRAIGGEVEKVMEVLNIAREDVVLMLTMVLGRVPSEVEVERECIRLAAIAQIELAAADKRYLATEVEPQNAVIQRRKKDFPKPEEALKAFRYAKAEIVRDEKDPTILRLLLHVEDAKGRVVVHPVMTTEEMAWVEGTADVIAHAVGKNGKVFIAGLGLGLLNRELIERGVAAERQVVAELNEDVIKKIGPKFRGKKTKGLQIRQGDFKSALREAVANGETFEAIMIDAYPNNSDEVNRDASSREVLELAWKALKPGGVLTFYPDSMFIPPRVLKILEELGVPASAIHYRVAEFDRRSGFVGKYHYGRYMGVIEIRKPLIERPEAERMLSQTLSGTQSVDQAPRIAA